MIPISSHRQIVFSKKGNLISKREIDAPEITRNNILCYDKKAKRMEDCVRNQSHNVCRKGNSLSEADKIKAGSTRRENTKRALEGFPDLLLSSHDDIMYFDFFDFTEASLSAFDSLVVFSECLFLLCHSANKRTWCKHSSVMTFSHFCP